jgi:methionyl-tRNA formyltransferase
VEIKLGDVTGYAIATSRNWRPNFVQNIGLRIGAKISLISDRESLTTDYLDAIGVTCIFFPHWSHIIPAEIYERYECIIFHMTDLPFGRGGSPLQNLISREIYETKISALRCVEELDAGPIYLKQPLALYGTAQEIYMRANAVIEDMIISIIKDKPKSQQQSGEPVVFKRRNERDGDIATLETLGQVNDFIRMLDAEGYPRAFLETEHLLFEFSRSSIRADHILADVIIKRKPDGK